MDGYAGLIHRRDTELSNSNPSFSSTLLDSIYRSIDGEVEDPQELEIFGDTMRKKQSSNSSVFKGSGCRNGGFPGAEAERRRIDRWTEEHVFARRNSEAEVDRKLGMWNSSSSGSSDSSSGVFSSSELESVCNVPSGGTSCYGLNRSKPKPIRTGKEISSSSSSTSHDHQAKTKKSRAPKIYGDLKKVKQPLSPGGRLASFLNSLFTAKKAKVSSAGSDEDRKPKSGNASTCSTASSFSRSCLSKSTTTPSSAARTAEKRSVRFFPVSVIVDADNRPCGHKNLDLPVKEEKSRRVEVTARDLLRNYQKKVEREFGLKRISGAGNNAVKNLKVFEDDGDDADSYASSDLFELDNLSAIGMERYGQELPVYETTNLGTNRAIAKGLIL
ncbi:unnamed protein product [Cuscuta epithymum]|uniref:Protein BIG GRAIN 1-like B n=1 Tax=Cuscuta epithymum TaxID=186058 RepID=A0AAV0EY17_9ASTE|nr:unnamed protein product [Cuscuta epithymum]